MQTQVTQKKILKLRTTPGVNTAGGEEAPPAPDTMQPPPMAEGPRESFTWAAILAIVAVLCFVALVAIQWIEHQELSSAFPMTPVTAAR